MSINFENMTPGEMLLENDIKPMGLTQNALARALGVPPRSIHRCGWAGFFDQSPRFWMSVQTGCNLRNAKQLVERVTRKVQSLRMAAA